VGIIIFKTNKITPTRPTSQKSGGPKLNQSKKNKMKQYQKDHLERVTTDLFTEWAIYGNLFIAFASFVGEGGIIEIGVDGNGEPSIKKDGKIHAMSSREAAVVEYRRLYKLTAK
jgi:hypothetical protein